jgi:hypothetical protein
MTRTLLALALLGASSAAFSYEYRLQFTPQAGARGLSVAGYAFKGQTVVGNCSYYTVSACSGRGCHPVTTQHPGTCTWDVYGNLLSMVPGAPTAPAAIGQNGTEIIYARSGASSTGSDTRGYGFVDTPASHYSWQTLNGGYAVIPDKSYAVVATLVSDGDRDLVVSGATVKPQISGMVTATAGKAVIVSNTCATAPLPPGSTCTVKVSYRPQSIKCTASPYGYAYTGITLSLVTNAGANTDFTERFTVTGVPICDD